MSEAIDAVGALGKAMEGGDAAAVRAQALQLLDDYPGHNGARNFAVEALLFCGAHKEALPHLRADQHLSLARAYGALGRFDEARQECRLAEQHGDLDAGSVYALGRWIESHANVAGERSRIRLRAGAATDAALRLRDVSRKYFLAGKWAESMQALRASQARMLQETGTKMPKLDGGASPQWTGERVGHLLLIHVDGAGDLLQFGRYVHEARERSQRITLACEPALHSVMLRSLPVDSVVAEHEMSPATQQADAWDYVTLLLADVLGVRYGAPMRIEPLAGSVPDLGAGVHVGLCWAASANGRSRSVPFASLEPLRSLPDVHFHSLQVGLAAEEARPWVQRHALSTYDDTTSLIGALDAVISVDTSVAHLAANIGKPTHVLLCPYEDWRWGTGDVTPWYPTMRLYRRNLGNAVKAIRASLSERSGQRQVEPVSAPARADVR